MLEIIDSNDDEDTENQSYESKVKKSRQGVRIKDKEEGGENRSSPNLNNQILP
jgi:hypothetical protein